MSEKKPTDPWWQTALLIIVVIAVVVALPFACGACVGLVELGRGSVAP